MAPAITSKGFARWKSAHVEQDGRDTVISIDDDVIVLAGVKASDLGFSDFAFQA